MRTHRRSRARAGAVRRNDGPICSKTAGVVVMVAAVTTLSGGYGQADVRAGSGPAVEPEVEAAADPAPAVLGSEVARSVLGSEVARSVLGSEVARSVPNPASVREPGGLGPVADIDMNRRSNQAATAVAHAVAPVVDARTGPADDAPIVASFTNPNERGGPAVFQVIGPTVDGWVEVRLPVRPNGTTGWVRTDEVALTTNPYRIDIDVAGFQLTITRDDEVVLVTTVSIGTGETPTPLGEFYLTELLRPPNPAGAYGPYAYGLSGFSDTLSSFNGGPGVIGIHGTNQPQFLGTNVSHGCIRVDNTVIVEMTTFLPLGTPVSIG